MLNNIESLFSQVTFKYVQNSMFMLLHNCYRLTSDTDNHLIYPICTKMDDITKKILSYTFDLQASLTYDEQESIGKDIAAHREYVIEIARELYAYSKMASMATSICIANRSADDPSCNLTIHDDIFERCNRYISTVTPETITNVSEELNKAFNIGTLLSYLPIKMTKEKYFDYVGKALKMLFKDMSCQSINDMVPMLKDKFYYDEAKISYFPQAWHDVLKLVNRAEKVKTFDEADEVLSDLDIFQEWLSKIMAVLDLQYECLCFLSLMRLLSLDINIFFEENIVYKDIYYAVKESLLSDDRTLYEENTLSSLEEYIETSIDQIRALEDSILKRFSKLKSLDDNITKMSQMLLTIQNIYFSSLNSSIYYLNASNKDEEEDNSACISKAVSDVLDYIKNNLSSISVKQQKLLREAFFEVIPSPLSAEEFFEYALLSLNTCNGSRQRDTLDLLSVQFSQVNLDMRHEHCDHEHGHDDNCDCGHHH